MWLPPPCLSSTISPALIPALIYSTPQDKWRPALSSGVLSLMPPVTRNMQRYNFSTEQWQTAFPPISGHLLLSLKSILPSQSLLHTLLFINVLIQVFIRETVLHSSLRYWFVEIFVLLKKFVSVERGYGDFLFTLKLDRFQVLHLFLFPYFSHSSNFPPKAGTERSCWRAQVIAIILSLESLFCSFSIFAVSTQACAQHCLQIRHLGDEWNLLAKSCDVLDFLRSEQLLQLPFHSLVLRTIFPVCYIHSLSHSARSSLPFRVSFAI